MFLTEKLVTCRTLLIAGKCSVNLYLIRYIRSQASDSDFEGGIAMDRNYIKEHRLAQGYKNQEKFARKAGVARSTLGEIERHSTPGSRGTLEKIAVALGVSVEGLYSPP